MTGNRGLKWLAVLVCAVSMTPAAGVGQDRTRTRTRVYSSPPQVPFVNLYTEQQSRTRLGLYLDARQSRRYDGDGALITGVMRDSSAEEAGLQDPAFETERRRVAGPHAQGQLVALGHTQLRRRVGDHAVEGGGPVSGGREPQLVKWQGVALVWHVSSVSHVSHAHEWCTFGAEL